MKVLYIGSGKSATQADNDVYNDYIKICLNNAWRIYENDKFDYWIHTGDFPRENYPAIKNYKTEISHKDYASACKKAADVLGWKTTSPEHYAGYTGFFQGLYWIMMELKPVEIALLGFDHDYNVEKTSKWLSDNKPNIQNNFNNKKEKTIKEWSSNYFNGFEEDFFYGHGTPDPLRLGEEYIRTKMLLAKDESNKLGISIVNHSLRKSPYTVFDQIIVSQKTED